MEHSTTNNGAGSDDRRAVEAFAKVLAAAENVSDFERLISRAKLLAAAAVSEDIFDTPPPLLSAIDHAQERARQIGIARAVIAEAGYDDNLGMLASGYTESAQALRFVVGQITADPHNDMTSDEARAAVLALATGETGEPGRIIDPLDIDDPQPPSQLIPGRLYAARFHELYGRYGTSKSTLTLHDACELALQGIHATIISWEMSEDGFAILIHDLGYSAKQREQMRPFLHFYEPERAFDHELLSIVMTLWPKTAYLVIDNMAEALASRGGEESSAKDTMAIRTLLRNLSRTRGVATEIIDHSGHGDQTHSRGSSAKGGITDVVWQIEAKPAVKRDRIGKLKLTCRKDRGSLFGVDTELWYEIGDGSGGLPITRIDAPREAGDLSANEAKIVAALQHYAEDHPGDAGFLATGAALELAKLPKSTASNREMLPDLAGRGFIEQRSLTRGNAAAVVQYRYIGPTPPGIDI